ncbi:hypothetical protein [Nannocystis pusilla]|uniref:hypothetical protein n=1 Tax=Nannocystis pusilla TaxID=889268 RepID=UPI003B77B56F
MPARRFCCLVLVGLAAACGPAVHPPGFEGGVPRLVADVGIGPFAVGMTRAQFEAAASAAGLMVRPGFSEANAYAGPYFVAFTDSDGECRRCSRRSRRSAGWCSRAGAAADSGSGVSTGRRRGESRRREAARLRCAGGRQRRRLACVRGRISVEVSGMEGTVSVRVQSAEAMRDREP